MNFGISEKPIYPFGMPPEGVDVLWRAEARRYSYIIDAERELYGTTNPKLELCWYTVKKRTPCGAWIDSKFVNLNCAKRYAVPTEEEALESFKARKKRQIKILSSRLSEAEEELQLLEGVL